MDRVLDIFNYFDCHWARSIKYHFYFFRLDVNIQIVQLVEDTTVQAAASERVLIMEARAAGVATASVGLQVNFSPFQRIFLKIMTLRLYPLQNVH